MKIIVAGGGWSTNIGNSLFNLGTLYILNQVLPQAEVILLSDQPAYLDFFRHKTPKNSLKIFNYVSPDYIVLHGSVLQRRFPQIWSESLDIMRKKGTKIIFISAGLSDYTDLEIEICKRYLKRNPPFLFISRDSETFKHFFHLAKYSYDGIDSAFFLPEVFSPIEIDLPPYIIFNFNKYTEPKVSIIYDDAALISEQNQSKELVRSRMFYFLGKMWKVEFPLIKYYISKQLQKFYPYMEALFPFCNRRSTYIGDYMIVRTDHQINPIFLRKVFRGPHTYVWDTPYTYLCLYANTTVTFSDRVHACVATLAYGKPAMLFSQSGRSRILNRIGAQDIYRQPTTVSQAKLSEEKKSLLNYLKSIPF